MSKIYMVWCDTCDTWISDYSTKMTTLSLSWICCTNCGNGVVMCVDNVKRLNPSHRAKINLAKMMWSL